MTVMTSEGITFQEQEQHKDASILLVEDDAGIRSMLPRVFSRSGYNNVTTCEDGEKAWALLQKAWENDHQSAEADMVRLPHIIWTDLDMGGGKKDGIALIRTLVNYVKEKKLPTGMSMPTIICSSGRLEPERIKELKELGVSTFVNKPYLKIMELPETVIQPALTQHFRQNPAVK